jgi:hypothetical protein
MASDDKNEEKEDLQLEDKKHVSFWLRHLRMLPTAYTSGDVQRCAQRHESRKKHR